MTNRALSFLEAAGHTVIRASRPGDVLRRAEETRPDLALLDGNGLSVAHALGAFHGISSMILIDTYSEHAVNWGMSQGARDFIQLDVTAQDPAALVRRVEQNGVRHREQLRHQWQTSQRLLQSLDPELAELLTAIAGGESHLGVMKMRHMNKAAYWKRMHRIRDTLGTETLEQAAALLGFHADEREVVQSSHFPVAMTWPQREVMRLLGAGFDRNGISRELGITVAGVNQRLASCYRALDVHTPIAASARYAALARRGLIATTLPVSQQAEDASAGGRALLDAFRRAQGTNGGRRPEGRSPAPWVTKSVEETLKLLPETQLELWKSLLSGHPRTAWRGQGSEKAAQGTENALLRHFGADNRAEVAALLVWAAPDAVAGLIGARDCVPDHLSWLQRRLLQFAAEGVTSFEALAERMGCDLPQVYETARRARRQLGTDSLSGAIVAYVLLQRDGLLPPPVQRDPVARASVNRAMQPLVHSWRNGRSNPAARSEFWRHEGRASVLQGLLEQLTGTETRVLLLTLQEASPDAIAQSSGLPRSTVHDAQKSVLAIFGLTAAYELGHFLQQAPSHLINADASESSLRVARPSTRRPTMPRPDVPGRAPLSHSVGTRRSAVGT